MENHSRRPRSAGRPPGAGSGGLGLEGAQDGLTLTLPAGWLAGHALSARELEVEAGQLRSAGLELSVVEG